MSTNTPTRPWHRGLLAAAGTLLVGAVALATSISPVSAAPSLSASENPVVIANNINTKNITVSWNLDGVPKATLDITEQGGPVVKSVPAPSQLGSTPLTVTYGKTYIAQLKSVPADATIATLTITTKRPSVGIPGGGLGDVPVGNVPGGGDIPGICFGLCSIDVDVTPHGTFAEFLVKTNSAAHFEIQVSTDAPNANHQFAHVDSSMFNLSNVTNWPTHVLNIQPNTFYHFVVKASDPTNTTKIYKHGTFKTLKRQVTVDFTGIYMIDDSDDLSDCDCQFWFKAGNVGPLEWSGGPGTGESFNPNAHITVTNAGDSVTLRVTGSDDDEFCGVGLCVCGQGMPNGNGSNDCADWSTVTKSVDVSLSGFGEEYSEPFEMTANGSPLKFKVGGTVTVKYIP